MQAYRSAREQRRGGCCVLRAPTSRGRNGEAGVPDGRGDGPRGGGGGVHDAADFFRLPGAGQWPR